MQEHSSNQPLPNDIAHVLVVDDEQSMCELLAAALEQAGHRVDWRLGPEDALTLLSETDYDVVLADLQLDGASGIELCREIVARRPNLPVVVVTAFGNVDAAVQAIRAGAYDFLRKPVDIDTLQLTVERALKHRRLHQELFRLRERMAGARAGFDGIIGDSRAMRSVFDMIERISDSDAPVLITGESGTGKELVARALHERSRYREGPLVPVNCAAIPATLLESTLFGHVKGAFTDAKSSSVGLCVQADGGTLFFDEIGEMPLEMQAKLLRVLQERRVRPVGGSEEIPFDARIVAATNRDLEEEVANKRFRQDLYYRINVVTIDLPPLRARGNDVLLLAQAALERTAARSGRSIVGIAPEAARKLLEYDWQGNVRELQNVIERAVALARFNKITIEDLPERIAHHRSDQIVIPSDDLEQMLTLEELEQRYIERVLRAAGGNKTHAASVLGIDRRTLHRKLARWSNGNNGHGSDTTHASSEMAEDRLS